MIDLYLQNPDGPVWPYSDQQLRLDNPRLSLSAELPDSELAQLRAMENPILVWRVRPSPRPTDTREERWTEAMPEPVEGVPMQRWLARPATPEELAAWDDASRPPADWDGFRRMALESQTIARAMATARSNCDPDLDASGVPPGEPAASALPAALAEAMAGNPAALAATWEVLVVRGGLGDEDLQPITEAAQQFNLPAAVIERLNPLASSG